MAWPAPADEAMALQAGQPVGSVTGRQTGAAIVRELADDAAHPPRRWC